MYEVAFLIAMEGEYTRTRTWNCLDLISFKKNKIKGFHVIEIILTEFCIDIK